MIIESSNGNYNLDYVIALDNDTDENCVML